MPVDPHDRLEDFLDYARDTEKLDIIKHLILKNGRIVTMVKMEMFLMF